MSHALLYRPNGKGALIIAFTCAAVVHLTAVALAGYERPPLVVTLEPEFPITGGEPPDERPLTPPESIEVPTAPPIIPPEFADEVPAPPKRATKPNGPIRPPTIGRVGAAGNPKAMALNAPRPEYPYEARSRHVTGTGVARLTIDPSSGVVTSAAMQQSTGSPVLDNSALSAFRRWRFRPGTPSTVTIPITYTMMGASY